VVPLHEITQSIYERTGVLIPSVYLWKTAFMFLVEQVGMDTARATGGHGANPLSSVGMHMFPDLMRPDLVEAPQPMRDVMGLSATGFGTATFQGIEINVPVGVYEVSANGVVGGDMRGVSAEIGAGLTDRLVGLFVDLAKHMIVQETV
jgi:creatinine amidohydrolase